MFRYVAFGWDSRSITQRDIVNMLMRRLCEQPRQWSEAVSLDGLRVLHAGAQSAIMEARALDDQRGVLLGAIFARSSDEAASADQTTAATSTAISQALARQASGLHGKILMERYWGNYVAVLQEHATGAVYLLRGPMCTLPCYLYRHRDVWVCFSHLADFRQLGLPVAICWDYVAAQARYLGRPSTEKTAVQAVTQVRAGECVRLVDGRATAQFYWNPMRIAAQEPVEDPGEAVELLRSCTCRCVYAWASGHARILHMLSGGLDSSVVLACLRDAPSRPLIHCFVEYSPQWAVDERPFARAAAAAAQCTLEVVRRDCEVSLEPLLCVPLVSPDPSHLVGVIEAGRVRAELAANHGASAISTGIGGDQVFYQAPASHGVRDYLQVRGLGPELLRHAYGAARIERLSVLQVLKRAWQVRRSNRRWGPLEDLSTQRGFLSEQLFACTQLRALYMHPWLEDADEVPDGKLQQIYTLAGRSFYYDPFGNAQARVSIAPLLSQPLVELCLRIPTYVHTEGGWDRSIARRAFAPQLPPQIAWRRGKGELGGHHRSMIIRNLPLIRGMLLEGELVRRQLLDRQRLEAFLALQSSRFDAGYAQILEYLSLEAWIRSAWSHSHAAIA